LKLGKLNLAAHLVQRIKDRPARSTRHRLRRANWSKLPPPANSFKKSAAADHVQAWYGAGCARDGAFFLFRMP
jgi:hypothetical protein